MLWFIPGDLQELLTNDNMHWNVRVFLAVEVVMPRVSAQMTCTSWSCLGGSSLHELLTQQKKLKGDGGFCCRWSCQGFPQQ